MAKRIVDRKPILGREDWQKSSQQNNAYLNNIAKYEANWHVRKVRICYFDLSYLNTRSLVGQCEEKRRFGNN